MKQTRNRMHYFNPDVLYAKGTTATKDDAKKFANLIGATDPKLDRVVREKLISARVGLLLKASFFGNMRCCIVCMITLDVAETETRSCGTLPMTIV
jgi:hypothetical protein